MDFETIWCNWPSASLFSGVFSATDENGLLFEKHQGFRNHNKQLPNKYSTAFGIASGTKLFTAIAVCQLIDQGQLSLTDTIWKLVPYDLGGIDKQVSVYHLLTHTSGIGDYIDEESPTVNEDLSQLYQEYPAPLWERLSFYLQMFTHLPAKFKPGSRFSYSNAGFALLGLVIEAVSKKSYQQYIADAIIAPLNLKHTGFYRTDALPVHAAYGYIKRK